MSKQSVTIVLDRPRSLRYGMNALVRIEELLGKPITKLDFDNISIKDLRTIVYAGLYHEDKSLSPEIVGDLIDEYSDISLAAEKLGEAMTEAFGKNAQRTKVKETETGIGIAS